MYTVVPVLPHAVYPMFIIFGNFQPTISTIIALFALIRSAEQLRTFLISLRNYCIIHTKMVNMGRNNLAVCESFFKAVPASLLFFKIYQQYLYDDSFIRRKGDRVARKVSVSQQ